MSEQAVKGISTRTQISINQKIDEGEYKGIAWSWLLMLADD